MTQKALTINLPLFSTAAALIFAALSILSLVVPFFLGHPQWLVGTIVNASLFLAAIFLPKKYFAPLIILPSLGVLTRGIVFGPFTPSLVYFLPFIWVGNFILISVFIIFRGAKNYIKRSEIFGGKSNHLKYFLSVFFAAAGKYLFLMAAANIYFKLHLAPKIFLQAMGINQFLTALAGGIISWFALNIYAKYSRS